MFEVFSGASEIRRSAQEVLLQAGMKSIIAGIVLIGIGLGIGDSIFTGNFGLTSIFFDGLGMFWIGKGIFNLWRRRQPQQ